MPLTRDRAGNEASWPASGPTGGPGAVPGCGSSDIAITPLPGTGRHEMCCGRERSPPGSVLHDDHLSLAVPSHPGHVLLPLAVRSAAWLNHVSCLRASQLPQHPPQSLCKSPLLGASPERLTSAISGGDQAYHDSHLVGVAYIQIPASAGRQAPAAALSQAGTPRYIRWSSGSGSILRHRQRQAHHPARMTPARLVPQ
jgi:hypothetical protein